MTSEEQAGTSAPPNDPQELKQQIEYTREQLGETVEALAAKADVKAQARAKASEVSGRLKSKAAQARQQAAAKTGELQDQLAGKAAVPRQKTAAITGPAADRARQQTAVAAERLSKVTPEPVQRAVAKAAAAARDRRVQLVIAAAALVLAWLKIRRRGHR
jgi:hypothetical protein